MSTLSPVSSPRRYTLLWERAAQLTCAFASAPLLYWFASREAMLWCLVMSMIVGLCITLGYHRLMTHGSYQTYEILKWIITFVPAIGGGSGSVLQWVATHRRHHQFEDTPDDPHTPLNGWLRSQVFWWVWREKGEDWEQSFKRYAPDLLVQPYIFLDKIQGGLFWGYLAVLYGLGYWSGGNFMGISYVVCIGCFGLFLTFNITSFVNSVSHGKNERGEYESKNVWWVGVLTNGEGFHKNHHENPTDADHGRGGWRQPDLSAAILRLLEAFGIVKKVKWSWLRNKARQAA